ncbi:hypothetical protein BV25DRAFT_1473624 [Artomyces pyxidatus]|uniref:Uncharacterized protein n=1 Tax=Artomyces pyxidatus TaxID=48021 RepID=A0ACB8SMJ9_9AGAM|nr:hypothetical protein BV25DRAFT_1473624 [Artomyces pyxidatus]
MHQIYDHLHSLAETKTRGSGKRLHRARAMFSIVAEEDIAASGVVRPAVTEGLAENELLSVELRSIQEIYTKDGWFIHNELWGKLFYELCALYERADIHHDIATVRVFTLSASQTIQQLRRRLYIKTSNYRRGPRMTQTCLNISSGGKRYMPRFALCRPNRRLM